MDIQRTSNWPARTQNADKMYTIFPVCMTAEINGSKFLLMGCLHDKANMKQT